MCYLQYANKEGKTKSHVQVCKAKCWDVLDICERKRVRLGLQSQMSGCLGLLQKNKYRAGTSDATILSALIYHYYHHHCCCCCYYWSFEVFPTSKTAIFVVRNITGQSDGPTDGQRSRILNPYLRLAIVPQAVYFL